VAHIPGGGAVGAAAERDPKLVERDVQAGLVSPESARAEYACEPQRMVGGTRETPRRMPV
jgi:N-methylhydantoinase B/oxoprolinase/acetone carboxylase alpha subunit